MPFHTGNKKLLEKSKAIWTKNEDLKLRLIKQRNWSY